MVEQDRGSLPFHLIHGEALVAAAAWALGESGVTPVDLSTSWAQLRESGEPFVLHDALCPMTPPDFIARCVRQAAASGAVVVGVRPVTDTVKVVRDDFLEATVDREGLVSVCSPVVLPAAVLAGLEGPPGTDLAALVEELGARHPVEQVVAPAAARRVHDDDEVALLEALTGESGG